MSPRLYPREGREQERHAELAELARLREIRDSVADAEELVSRVGKDEFLADRIMQNAGAMICARIGEAANHLPDGFKAAHPDVAWKLMLGMRNTADHKYWALDWETVWATLVTDVPPLREQLELDDLPGDRA